jgi:outer membrane lipoprotein-sorting protein
MVNARLFIFVICVSLILTLFGCLQEKEEIEEIKEKVIGKYESIESLSYRVKEKFEFNSFRHELTAWVASKKTLDVLLRG